ncbi:hypothetical protein DBR27_13515 [Flavobacterium sp. HMWF030]|nr:hypothetical protein DBR27_13515 [Flavobacterium sp. HMWF030]
MDKDHGADYKTLWHLQLQPSGCLHRIAGTSALRQLLDTGEARQGVEDQITVGLYRARERRDS